MKETFVVLPVRSSTLIGHVVLESTHNRFVIGRIVLSLWKILGCDFQFTTGFETENVPWSLQKMMAHLERR